MMMTGDWTIPHGGPRDPRADVARPAPCRAADDGVAEAVSMAFRAPPPDIPDDLVGLLARLN